MFQKQWQVKNLIVKEYIKKKPTNQLCTVRWLQQGPYDPTQEKTLPD